MSPTASCQNVVYKDTSRTFSSLTYFARALFKISSLKFIVRNQSKEKKNRTFNRSLIDCIWQPILLKITAVKNCTSQNLEERKKAIVFPKEFKKHFAVLIAFANICPDTILEFSTVKEYVRITFINPSLSPSLFLLPYA